MAGITYCDECGGRLTLYVVGVCSDCGHLLTGEDPERDEHEARMGAWRVESAGESTEA